MGTTKSREFKTEWLKKAISDFFAKKPTSTISKKKLVAQFCLANVSTKQTAYELLGFLKETGFIEMKGDIITK